MRRRLFASHVLVIVIALAVLAAVLGLIELTGETRTLRIGRRATGPGALFVGFLAAITASAIVSWRTTERLARPLEEIGAATRELAAGRYDVRAPRAETVELDELAADVNQLANELRITEQRRLRLIGDVAHELRNPLSTIQGMMEALVDGIVPADADTYGRIGREAARLRRLADDLSSLSAAGELNVVNHETVDLNAIISDVVAQLEPQAGAKDLALTFVATPLPTLAGDRDRLTQVLMNVVGNAVQYTETGSVEVRSTVAEASVLIEVTDTGRGLDLDAQSRIFERFHRVDEHFADGTGVGLAIAKLIVEAHGGAINALSEGLNLGATVRIELPTSQG